MYAYRDHIILKEKNKHNIYRNFVMLNDTNILILNLIL